MEAEKTLVPARTGPYTAKDKVWQDASGTSIPYARVTALEKLKEKNAWLLANEARKLEAALTAYRELHIKLDKEVAEAFDKKEGSEVRKSKGNREWGDMSRTVRIEVKVQENMEFDGLTIAAARERLDQYIEQTLSNQDELMIVDMVKGAFATRKGQLDPKRVLSLLPYRHRTKSALFHEACDLIEKSLTRTYSKTYRTVAMRKENGEMVQVQLNFSALL